MKKILILIFSLFIFLTIHAQAQAGDQINLYLFYSQSCPHCADERQFLTELQEKYLWLNINEYEVTDSHTQSLLRNVTGTLNTQVNGVPFTVVCGEYFTGFTDNLTYQKNIEQMLVGFHEEECVDPIKQFLPEESAAEQLVKEAGKETTSIRETVEVPLLGELSIKNLSLPVFTFIVALLDGFNPCAMWVLIFLIGLLVGMKDRFKMWTLGTTFILASGLMYFMFLAAWLHLFLFLGLIKWVRIGIGLFALAAGGYYLHDYQTNKVAACKVTGGQKRKKVFEQLKNITQNKNFLLALIGIILLAFAVNLVELICSAGLPAVYTEVLSLTPMPKWQYYLYLLFYILIFMLDDLIVYIIAMKTLHAVGISGKYSRFSHLVGGIVMLFIGLAMIFRPELLMFG